MLVCGSGVAVVVAVVAVVAWQWCPSGLAVMRRRYGGAVW